MAKSKDTEKENISIKKMNRQLIEQRLEDAFADFKDFTSKKKLKQSIRKAGKLINSTLSKKTFEKLRGNKRKYSSC